MRIILAVPSWQQQCGGCNSSLLSFEMANNEYDDIGDDGNDDMATVYKRRPRARFRQLSMPGVRSEMPP